MPGAAYWSLSVAWTSETGVPFDWAWVEVGGAEVVEV